MNWRHVQLIFQREMNDQLRDRRTLFTITVLPILLYPFLGMVMLQVAQFKHDSSVRIQVSGLENWPNSLPLLDEQGELIVRPGMERVAKLITFDQLGWQSGAVTAEAEPDSLLSAEEEQKPKSTSVEDRAALAIKADQAELVLIIHPDFGKRLEERINTDEAGQASRLSESELKADEDSSDVSDDGLQIVGNFARDRSQIAQQRLETILEQWQKVWAGSYLDEAGISPDLFASLSLQSTDLAPPSAKRAMLWSKVLPFVMLIWALTGAFYPAIDLCAGEKERGTLETLLSSPARRREIVWGKLGAIYVFSIGSALLNLLSMHLTAGMIVKQLATQGTPRLAETLGPMPIHALGWLVFLLLPLSAFFSALALAVAALARSTKEGQYYLMPLLLVTLPLVALPLMPSMELNLGTSLIPVSGAIFLARSLIEGRYLEALAHLPVVLLVTATCCWFSIRWAIRQFESESVMFRESGRWNMRLWIHHLWRDRQDTASPAEAVLCGVIIIVGMFFAQFVAGSSITSWVDIAKSTVVVQVGLILTPSLLMGIFLTRSAKSALRVHVPRPSHLLAAVGLGVCMHPSYMLLSNGIQQLYQIGEETQVVLQYFQSMVTAQPLWTILLLMAVLPAICEELAFRGFIFGGLLRGQAVLRAIVVSALFFGFTHTVLQQSISASLMGLVLGYIAWRTGGVICTMVVHAINNALSLTLAWCGANAVDIPAGISWAISNQEGAVAYESSWVTISMLLSLGLLVIITRRSPQKRLLAQGEYA